MQEYKMTYTEGLTINKTITIAAKDMNEALCILMMNNPNAIVESIEKVDKEVV